MSNPNPRITRPTTVFGHSTFSWFRPPNNNLHRYVTLASISIIPPVGTSVLAHVTFVFLHPATWSATHRYRVAYNSWSPTIQLKSNHSSFFILHSTLLYSSFNPSLLIFWVWPIQGFQHAYHVQVLAEVLDWAVFIGSLSAGRTYSVSITSLSALWFCCACVYTDTNIRRCIVA